MLLLEDALVKLLLERPAVQDTVANTTNQGRVTDDLAVSILHVALRTLTTGEGDILKSRLVAAKET